MKFLRYSRNGLVLLSVVLWIFWILLFYELWQVMIEQAAGSSVVYESRASFQLANFVVGYLWFYVVLLVLVLAAEWAVFGVAAWVLTRMSQPSDHPLFRTLRESTTPLDSDAGVQLFLHLYCTVDDLPGELRGDRLSSEMLVAGFEGLARRGVVTTPCSGVICRGSS